MSQIVVLSKDGYLAPSASKEVLRDHGFSEELLNIYESGDFILRTKTGFLTYDRDNYSIVYPLNFIINESGYKDNVFIVSTNIESFKWALENIPSDYASMSRNELYNHYSEIAKLDEEYEELYEYVRLDYMSKDSVASSLSTTIFKSIDELESFLNTDLKVLSREIKTIKNEISKSDNSSLPMDKSSLAPFRMLQSQIESSKALVEQLGKKQRALMAILRDELEIKRNKLNDVVVYFSNKLLSIESFLETMDVYELAKDSLVQFQKGKDMPISEPLKIFQEIRYMDEEYGVPGQQSIDFNSVDVFFEFLKEGHYKTILAPKSVTAFRIRRKRDYYYNDNPFINRMLNDVNMNTFYIFRNGENLYFFETEWTFDMLFPKDDFMVKLNAEIEKANEIEDDMRRSNEIEKLKRTFLTENKKILVIEGILKGTDILKLEPTSDGKESLIQNPLSVEEGRIQYLDNSTLLLKPDNERPSYYEWKQEMSSKIQRGNRIIFIAGDMDGYSHQRFTDAIEYSYNKKYLTSYPQRDVLYTVETEKDMPKGAIGYIMVARNRDWLEKSNRMKFYLYEDDDLVNFDMIQMEDLDYYLIDREVRRKYMKTMNFLLSAKKQKLAEIEDEKHFINLVRNLTYQGKKFTEDEVLASIKWWKNKVINKRPIASDDAKALRMIKTALEKGKFAKLN